VRQRRQPSKLQPSRLQPFTLGTMGRLGRWAVAGVLFGCAVTACSSGPPPVPTATSSTAGQFRSSDAPALLVQCMLSQGTLGRSDSVFSGSPGWLRKGNIVITATTAAKFDAWYRDNDAISVAGKTLSQWTQWAAANNQLPAAVCGSSVSASTLQRQVFGRDPAAGNPWGA
jgi:hypothetical protein